MRAAVKLHGVVTPDHRLEVELPDEVPPGPAEIILLTGQPGSADAREDALGLDRGKGWIAEDFDAPLPEELQRLFEGAG
jgi:hypothetical protein